MASEGLRALDALQAAYAERLSRVRASAESGRGVIGYLGADAPVELIEATGATAYQLHGAAQAASPKATEVLGSSVDTWAPAVLDLMLQQAFGPLTAVLATRDCQSSMYLFYALRELRRLEPQLGLPPVHLLDMLHLPSPHTLAYNTARLGELANEVLPQWLGRDPLADDELAAAIRTRRRLRELLGEVEQLRRQPAPRLTGTQALRIHGAVRTMPAAAAVPLLEALLANTQSLPTVTPTLRLFLTGSNQDTDLAYVALESDGAVIVGEDHDWGTTGGYDVESDTLPALAAAVRDRGPAAPTSTMARRAEATARAVSRCAADHVLSYIRHGDEAPSWDYPAQQTVLADQGIPTTLLAAQPYVPDHARLREAVAVLRPAVSGRGHR